MVCYCWKTFAFIAAILAAFFIHGTKAAGDNDETIAGETAVLLLSVLAAALPEELGLDDDEGSRKRKQAQHRNRTRKFVNAIFDELGPCYVKRSYRMDAKEFWTLHRMLKPYFPPPGKISATKKRAGAKNGNITSSVRLSAALRYFAGGRPEDICLVHGISHTEVFRSVWFVVDAVNSCREDILQISYPTDHQKQKAIAEARLQKAKQSGVRLLCWLY